MSVELISVLIAVVAVGVALAGLMLTSQRAIRAELTEQRRELAEQRRDFSTELAAQRRDFSTELATHHQEISTELAAQRQYIDERFTALEQQIAELRERMAHLEGLLDGLREAIAIRQGAA